MLRRYTIVRGAPKADQEAGQPAAKPKFRGGARGPAAGNGHKPGEARLEVESAELSPKDVRDAARDPSISAAAPVMPTRLIKPLRVDKNAKPAGQMASWGIVAVGADRSPFDGSGVIPCVLDTGIDREHAAFAGVEIVEADFTGEGTGDGHGHGTHCAGTIFGRDVDKIRIGIARGVQKALIGKVLDSQGSGDTDMLYQGMQWALNSGAQVISMSIGFDFPGYVQQAVDQGMRPDAATSIALEAYRYNLRTFDAVMQFIAVRADLPNGAIVVAASGNESGRDEEPPFEIAVSIPAAASGIVSVGAIGRSQQGFEVAPFSNTLPALSAPGVDIVSAQAGGGLVGMSGTSMATPHVAGVATLWWQAVSGGSGKLTARRVESSLRTGVSTDGFASSAEEADYGAGMVKAPQGASVRRAAQPAEPALVATRR